MTFLLSPLIKILAPRAIAGQEIDVAAGVTLEEEVLARRSSSRFLSSRLTVGRFLSGHGASGTDTMVSKLASAALVSS
jgi:hypothetical protein